ncbi:hypothetical protein N0V93_002583 [Gnomoniopsis smithogilvyi]|uniref:LysM domain-containing protein n=1 Tax=Gnomoniopsis smithogilvyi TaxID=1191159 RepID=A0A9W8YV32_9PEZI|nr:hypothetical protein N0V93_002583 [Gnomoniopsis smithogilvyi]
MPGYASSTAALALSTLTGDPATTWPSINYTRATATTTAMPLATDTRSDCWEYFNGTRYIGAAAVYSYPGSDCYMAVQVLEVTLEDLSVWNPSLGDTSLSNCTFESGYQYCGKYYVEDATTSTNTDDSDEDAIATGSLTEDEGCTDYVDVCSGCGWDCSTILDLYNITIAQFYVWNPLVGSQCTGMQLGYQYCVSNTTVTDDTTQTYSTKTVSETTSASSGSVSSTAPPTTTAATATTTTATTTGATAPAATQTGQPSNCDEWYVVQDGDYCYLIYTEYNISSDDFYAWNPAVSSDCSSGLWPGYAYCVGVSS